MRMTPEDRADLAFLMKDRHARSAAELVRQLLVEEVGRAKHARALEARHLRGETIHERPSRGRRRRRAVYTPGGQF